MRAHVLIASVAVLVAVTSGCAAGKGHDALRLFFDGVDEPVAEPWQRRAQTCPASRCLEDFDEPPVPYAAAISRGSARAETMGASLPEPASEPAFAVVTESEPPSQAQSAAAVEHGAERVAGPVVESRPAAPAPDERVVTAEPRSAKSDERTATAETGPIASPEREAPAQQRPVPKIAAVPSSVPKQEVPARVRSGAPGIDLQVAAFVSEKNAEALKATLAPEFPTVRVDAWPPVEKAWYRVRVGPFPTDDAARKAEARLKAMGHNPIRYGVRGSAR